MAPKEIHSLNVVILKKYGCHVMKYRSGVMRKQFIDCTVQYCIASKYLYIRSRETSIRKGLHKSSIVRNEIRGFLHVRDLAFRNKYKSLEFRTM